MNISEIFLVEPYNAYTVQKGGRKKHWHEVIEEEALMQRIIAEQQAQQQALLEAQNSRTLPPNSPDISSPVVGNMNAGAGGMPVYDFFHSELDVINFDRSPSSGAGPMTVIFTNVTTTPQFDQYLWLFGDGTTSTEKDPIHIFQTGSVDGKVYTSSLQVTNSITGAPGGVSPNVYTIVSYPVVTAGFTFTTSSNTSGSIATFTNTTVNTSQTPTTTYLWTFGSGSLISNVINPTPVTYTVSGPYTASLQSTGSYGIASKFTQSWSIS